jgi:hypothetical protein
MMRRRDASGIGASVSRHRSSATRPNVAGFSVVIGAAGAAVIALATTTYGLIFLPGHLESRR